MTETTLVAGDYGYYLTFYLKEYNPLTALTSSFDLTNANTINFKAQKYGETTLKVSGICNPVTATLGICRYQVQSGDFDSAGDYISEVEVVESGAINTWRNIHIQVDSQLPK